MMNTFVCVCAYKNHTKDRKKPVHQKLEGRKAGVRWNSQPAEIRTPMGALARQFQFSPWGTKVGKEKEPRGLKRRKGTDNHLERV